MPTNQPIVVSWQIIPDTPANRTTATNLLAMLFASLSPGQAFPAVPPTGQFNPSVGWAQFSAVPSTPSSPDHLLVLGEQVFLDAEPEEPEELEAFQAYGLPSVQVERVAEAIEEPTRPLYVINRVPEPDEVEVPHQTRGAPTRIVFQLYGPDVITAPAAVRIDLDDAPIYEAETWSTGYSGTVETIGNDAALRFSFYRATPFESAQRIALRVWANGEVIATWAFTWLDETRPTLEDVTSSELEFVRAVYDEPIDEDDMVDATKYAFTRVSKVAYVPSVVRVEREDARTARVYPSGPLTFGATYTLTVTGAHDAYGNPIAVAPDNAITFTAYSPPVPEGRRFVLWDFIPQLHKRADRDTGELEGFISVVQEPTDQLLHQIDGLARVTDPDLAPEPFVDAMLADLGNPFTITGLTLAEKRKLLSLLLSLYKQRGTTEGLIHGARTLLGLETAVHPLNEGGWMLGVHELGNPDTTWLGPETSFQRFAFEVEVVPQQLAAYEGWELERVKLSALFDGAWDEQLDTLNLTAGGYLGFGEPALARLIELAHFMRPAHTHLRSLWAWLPISPA